MRKVLTISTLLMFTTSITFGQFLRKTKTNSGGGE